MTCGNLVEFEVQKQGADKLCAFAERRWKPLSLKTLIFVNDFCNAFNTLNAFRILS